MFDVNSFLNMLKQSKIRFSILGTTHRVAVQTYTVTERISDCFTISLSLVSEDEIKKPEEIVEKEGLLTVAGHLGDRYFHGIINNFVLSGKNGRFYLYSASVVPSLWFLILNQDCRIFQNTTVPDIVKEILKDNNIDTKHYEFRTTGTYKKRRYCVQYRETDFVFISRLLEEEGIYYFFEHSKDKHLLVFGDSTVAYKPIEGLTTIKHKSGGGMVHTEESISGFVLSQTVCSGLIVQSAHNFKKPSMGQETKAQGKTNDKYEIYDFPHNYGYPDDGSRLAKQRLEEHKMQEQTATGASNCVRLMPGHTFTLYGHDFSSLDKEYVLLSVNHGGEQSHVLGEQTGIGGDFTYNNSFSVVPSSVTVRPGKSLQKPIIHGLQSATVVGPPGEEIYVDPDNYGRVKVQFHWDRRGKKDDNSSCWLRCAQSWGGGGWGTVFIPRVGDEVLVSFMEGDPDWPIITGSVYNGANPPLYDLPANKTRTTIKTRSTPNSNGFNELRFEDKAGQEEVYLQGEKDWNILIKNDKGQTVGHDETLDVGNNRSKTVGVNQTVSIGANHTETIGANKTETVTINKMETVGVAKELTVGGLYQVTVGAAMNETVAAAKTEEVGLTKAVFVGVHMTEKILGNRSIAVDKDMSTTVKHNTTLKSKTITFEADDEIVFKTGESTISMKSSGEIVVKGATITENASGEIVIKGAKTSIN